MRPTVAGSRPGYKETQHMHWKTNSSGYWTLFHSRGKPWEYLVLNDLRHQRVEKSPFVNQPPDTVTHQVTHKCSPMLMQVIHAMGSAPSSL